MIEDQMRLIKKEKEQWEKKYKKNKIRDADYTTVSSMEVPSLSTPDFLDNSEFLNQIGFPGSYPYTRGIHDTMYRGRLWTMRQFAGFGSPENTNKRFKFLLNNGQTGLSTAFDMPVLMGYDCDSPRARGEVGNEGVSISTIADMETLFDGINLADISTSMTVNSTASILLAMYLVIAEKKRIKWDKLRGTIQNDMLKEFIAQREWISPPESSVKIVVDMIEFCTNEVPLWSPVSISGYHIREAGSTAIQELAFTIADGICYVDESIKRGMDVDDFAPRLSFFFNLHNDFFEEIAKLRAARRMWAKIMKERFGAKNPKSLMLKTHTQTAGCSLTAQQPINNVIRVALQAMAGVLGGTQSLHTNCMDETLSLPTEESVTLALRTQQIIAEESGVVNTIDPLGGSYFIEELTNKIEEEAFDYIKKIDDMGGIISCIENGYPQNEIANAAYVYQKQLDKGQKTIVGVNKYHSEKEEDIILHKIDKQVENRQIKRIKEVKSSRNNKSVESSLTKIRDAAVNGNNLMPFIIEGVREYVTLGEISNIFRDVYGEYSDPGYY
ncbi:MAG: methylmalonyl-CoA mutase family protein [Candidatus Dadabacteria bacterium]|nr:methylmalonyl-CoA mutase family protein [Candidatus Dadabacteria bacterium]